MIRIEGHWESIETIRDVSRVVREYYNEELADKIDDLIPNTDDLEGDLEELEELRNIVYEIRELVC